MKHQVSSDLKVLQEPPENLEGCVLLTQLTSGLLMTSCICSRCRVGEDPPKTVCKRFSFIIQQYYSSLFKIDSAVSNALLSASTLID
mmetsp:Transcript_40487/g.160639  ORF Transcript_40487/g.160639 Transcript_40487/m.160639 type:complete len:87 (+) Transcript_40487:1088-1348(+)